MTWIGAAALGLCCAFGIVGCGSGTSSTSTSEAGASAAAKSAQECPAGPPYADRWPDVMLGGPSSGPVTLATGRDGMEHGLTAVWNAAYKVLFAKMLIGIAAPPGTSISFEGSLVGSGSPVSFTHLGGSLKRVAADLAAPVHGRLPDRQPGGEGVTDLPGYIVAEEAGCARIAMQVGDRGVGPFYVRLLPPPGR